MLIISTVLLFNSLMPDQDFSFSERRALQPLPEFNIEGLLDGKLFNDFGVYTIDQFMYRNKLRTLKHFVASEIMGQKDINGIYYSKGHIFKQVQRDDKSVLNTLTYINMVKSTYFDRHDAYFAMIPDKSYFNEHHVFQSNDEDLINLFKHSLDDVEMIDIIKSLSLNSYFETDPHWKQNALEPVILALSKEMNFEMYDSFDEVTLKNFKGAYYAQGPLHKAQEDLIYLNHEDFKALEIVNYGNKNKEGVIYAPDLINHVDPFDVFLGGASPLIEITNPNATSDEELIIFRDSFGSNIGPLFLKHYKKVTLVDTRYMPVASLEDFIVIKDQKLLFLYSSLIINNSFTLK